MPKKNKNGQGKWKIGLGEVMESQGISKLGICSNPVKFLEESGTYRYTMVCIENSENVWTFSRMFCNFLARML